MDFGICFKGFVSPKRARHLVRQAETAGFTHCWFYDSPILWADPYPMMAMCMEHTTTMRFGPCVTNPNARDWAMAASLFGSLARESAGSTNCWFYDLPTLCGDPYPMMAVSMVDTTTIRFGSCVTNPNARDWSMAASLFGSLARQSGGRFDVGLGRGDSFLRMMGKK